MSPLHLSAQMVMPFRATVGLKLRARGREDILLPSPFPVTSFLSNPRGGAMPGAKTRARKDISFHRCKTVFPSASVLFLSLRGQYEKAKMRVQRVSRV